MRLLPHRQSFVAHPLAYLAVALACGIILAQSISLTLVLIVPSAFLIAALAFVCFLKRKLLMTTVFIAASFVLLGAAVAVIEEHNVGADRFRRLLDDGTVAAGDPIELTAVLASEPEPAPESFYLRLRVERLRYKDRARSASGLVAVLVPVPTPQREAYERLNLHYGARIRVITKLKRADNFRNPGVSSFTEYLERKGYDASGFIKSPLLIERLDDQRVFPPLVWLYRWRARLQERISSQFNSETAAVLNASLLGNRYFLSRRTSERFRAGGTFHVLVISGMHISFIGGLVFLIARRFTRRKGCQFVLSTIIVWCYAIAVGAEASVLRAALMFTLIAFAPVVARCGGSLNALAATALVLLIWRPSDLFDPSFQLTFISVLAIVIVAWPILQRVREIGSWRPTRDKPYPPACPSLLRSFAELLFWSEKDWQHDLARLNYRYKLFKVPLAAKLERYRLQSFLRYSFAALLVSTGVQLTLLPFLIIYFHRLSISALLLNIEVSVLIAILTFTSIAAMLVSLLSQTLAVPLISLTNALDWFLVHSVDPFVSFGVASVRLPEYPGRAVVLYGLFYLPLVIIALALSRWDPLAHPAEPDRKGKQVRKVVGIAVGTQVLLAVILIAHPWSAPPGDGGLRIDFLDVGQGDSALVTMPDGITILVDGGGRPLFRKRHEEQVDVKDGEAEIFEPDTRSIGEAVVSEFLWSRGLGRVDYILATHADADHIDGLNDVARNFDVRAALVARAPLSDPQYLEFSRTADANGLPIQLVAAGDVLQLGATSAEVLWPPAADNAEAPSRNNDSIVLSLRYGERRILLTGDIERGAESALVARERDLKSDVVKIAHHGSRTSSTPPFVEAVQPQLAVISVGQTSIFGHPHREVLQRWLAVGATVLTTGRSGSITVITDGRDLKVETFVKE